MANGTHIEIWPVWGVWAGLMAASCAGFALAEGVGSAQFATCLGLILAAAKIHVIFGHYMDVTWRHKPLRLILQGWLLIVAAILFITYFIK